MYHNFKVNNKEANLKFRLFIYRYLNLKIKNLKLNGIFAKVVKFLINHFKQNFIFVDK